LLLIKSKFFCFVLLNQVKKEPCTVLTKYKDRLKY
jgi:hypothetical protein